MSFMAQNQEMRANSAHVCQLRFILLQTDFYILSMYETEMIVQI